MVGAKFFFEHIRPIFKNTFQLFVYNKVFINAPRLPKGG